MLTRYKDDWVGNYIAICNLGKIDGRKTNIYEVTTLDGVKVLLGTIKWYGRWRKYVFQPEQETIYEETCLRDIAQFIEDETKAHRAKAKAARA